jgi:6-phosphogluconate dehydrogenase
MGIRVDDIRRSGQCQGKDAPKAPPAKYTGPMQIGIIGLGKMGGNMAQAPGCRGASWRSTTWTPARIEELRRAGADGADSARELVEHLAPRRVVLLMLPAGEPTEALVQGLAGLLASGDILIDGGNGFYRDDVRRAAALAPRGILYLDAGVSGGIWGLKEGYCTMVGGEKEAFQHIEPLLRTCPPGGYIAVRPAPGIS